jgi:DNA polymerase III epsilon subunit-like protein
MAEIIYYVLDLETTGLSAKDHEINEISIIRVKDKVQLTKHVRCEYPERASFDALRITNKTIADLDNGISKEEAISIVEKFFQQDGLSPEFRCIIGHNIIAFDKKMLFALWEKCGKEFPAHLWMDTMHMTKQHAKNAGIVKPKVNLQASCDMLQIKKVAGMHNAKSDTRNCYLLWEKLKESNIDYLPFIKTFAHKINNDSEETLEDLF